jgi:CDP-paratose 2-epimerase
MKIIITGICGFVGSALAQSWLEQGHHTIIGLDNLSRPGSQVNWQKLRSMGVRVIHGDIRHASDVDALPPADAVIDAAANPSVLAGVDGQSSSRQLVEHNLAGTINLLEYCRRHQAAFVMLSTSRVYQITALLAVPTHAQGPRFVPGAPASSIPGFSEAGINETFPTGAPCSLYGATKLASENMALEYGQAFKFPVWINRCGVMAGAGQFARADQGIFSYWIHSWHENAPLKYIGFDGTGRQVRDCLHLIPLLDQQLAQPHHDWPVADRVINVSGGMASAMSLAELSQWCAAHLKVERRVAADLTPRPFDLSWIVLDHSKATRLWNWQPRQSTHDILLGIADHARAHPDWLSLSRA